MTVERESGKKLFVEAQEAIESALKFVAFRRRLGATDFHELRSFVMFKLIDNDYARLRKHDSEGSLTAYLSVVVHRLYLDFQNARWGKWHPSAEAERRGGVAVELERLVYRDGFQVAEAVEHIVMRGASPRSRDELVALAYALPVRHRPRLVAEEQLRVVTTGAVDPVEVSERDALVDKLQGELVRAMSSLDAGDRLLLKMRYRDRHTVPQIAQRLGLEAKPLYARMRRLLGRVRARLERAGLGGDNATSLVRSRAREIDLDVVFSAA